MAPRETENNAHAKFWGDKQRALWYVMVFSGVVNLVLLYKCLGKSQNSLISFARFKFCKSSFVVLSFALITLPY